MDKIESFKCHETQKVYNKWGKTLNSETVGVKSTVYAFLFLKVKKIVVFPVKIYEEKFLSNLYYTEIILNINSFPSNNMKRCSQL